MTWYEEKYQWGVKALPEKTTKEQWDKWLLDMRNHVARVNRRREFLTAICDSVEKWGVEHTEKVFNAELDRELSMDRPNEPGYYRAAND